MIYIIDTHTLVWYLEESNKLTPISIDIMENKSNKLVIPTIVLAEIKYLSTRSKVNLSLDDVLLHLESDACCILYPLDSNVVEFLPVSLDIHDGIICGTALVYKNLFREKVKIITKDEEIVNSGIVETIW